MHPVREYLERCQAKWDRVPRIDTWLAEYAQAEDTEFTRAVGALFLIAGVRRIRQPGCKFDTLLVLEGEQGSGKSSLGRALAAHEDWFGDSLPLGADPKVTNELTAGKWIVEHAELTGITKSEVENVKAFLSRQVDEAREAYGRHKTRVPRQFVLIGTTNDDRYLIDTTGNRRFLPVRCTGGPGSIDVERLVRDRDQLWGEAATREARGESIMLRPELWSVAAETRERRRMPSPIEVTLTDLVEGIEEGFIANEDVRAAVSLRPGQGEMRHQKAIDGGLDHLADAEALDRVPGFVKRHHAPIASFIPRTVGHQVQRIAADILVRILLMPIENGITALPIHDAVLVRQDCVDEAKAIMATAFEEIAGVTAVVREKRQGA